MATPVDEITNPFDDSLAMDPSSHTSKDSTGAETTPQNGRKERPKEKKRVGFTGSSPSDDAGPSTGTTESATRTPPGLTRSPPVASSDVSGASTPGRGTTGSDDTLLPQLASESRSHLPELSVDDTEQIRRAFSHRLEPPRPRPAIRRIPSTPPTVLEEQEEESDKPDDAKAYRKRRAQEAFQRGKELERDERIQSGPPSRYSSPERRGRPHDPSISVTPDDIPLQMLDTKTSERDSDEDTAVGQSTPFHRAQELVDKHKADNAAFHDELGFTGLRSGAVTPVEDHRFFEEYKPAPERYRGGILGALLKLYDGQNPAEAHDGHASAPRSHHTRGQSGNSFSLSADPTPQHSPPDSGTTTPKWKRGSWYSHHTNASTNSLAHLVGTSASLGSPLVSGLGDQVSQRLREQQKRPGLGKRVRSSGALSALNKHMKTRANEEIRIKNHISEIIARQRYLQRLCKALMMYGAPTHRLEEYMQMSSRVLEMEAQFLYIPGAMIMSFNDPSTHTTEVKLVKVPQGLDLGKLRDVHETYKEVVHDRIGVEEAMQQLTRVMSKKPKHSRWIRIPVYGLASVCVGPFAFGARLIDLPIAFLLGCILGVLQLVIAPASDLYANVFEIAASVITSFLARAFGSINHGNTFCFSALAQSSIALILPGYTVLCASLELQSRNLVAGSVRMVYAIIYSLFLGFGITIGTALYGLIDRNATSNTTCADQLPSHWFFVFVPGFTLCLIVINQAKWKQAPVMLVIAFAGYVVNYFSSLRFVGNTQVSNTLSAFAIGVLANAYSRVGSRVENLALDLWELRLRAHWRRFRRVVFCVAARARTPKNLEEGTAAAAAAAADADSAFMPKARRVGYSLAAAAMLPAIFVQVPSGLAVSGSLVSGLASADQITGNATNGTQVANLTTLTSTSQQSLNTIALNVGYSVIQVAIGITVGLFLSAIVVYPFGKRRSGLFSF